MKKAKFTILTVLIIVLLIVIIFCLCAKTKQMNDKGNGTENTFDISDNSFKKENETENTFDALDNSCEKEITTVYPFDISDYSWELEKCGYQKNVGPVTTKNIAIDKAKQLWKERFGNIYEINDLPIAVAYDEKSECWRVNGTLQDDIENGAVPCALITKDGDVLAMWIG